MKNTKNVQRIKELAILIRHIKNSKKKKHPTYGNYANSWGWTSNEEESKEARCRSIAQGLLNKKIKYEDIEKLNFSEFEKFISKLGFEKHLRSNTIRLSPLRLTEYMREDEHVSS